MQYNEDKGFRCFNQKYSITVYSSRFHSDRPLDLDGGGGVQYAVGGGEDRLW